MEFFFGKNVVLFSLFLFGYIIIKRLSKFVNSSLVDRIKPLKTKRKKIKLNFQDLREKIELTIVDTNRRRIQHHHVGMPIDVRLAF